MKVEPVRQHNWLMKLLGEWTTESECPAGPDEPAQKMRGTESVRAIGPAWVVCEGKGQMPGGSPATMIMTLGYDIVKKRFVGTWIGSMMTHLWVYDGELDASEKALTLSAEGPDFTTEGKTANYRDVIEFKTDDHRTLTSYCQGTDGQWQQFMLAHYRRKK